MCSVGYVPKYIGGISLANTRLQVFRKIRHGLNTVLETPVYKVRYELDTGTRHFGKFGTVSTPVPGNLVRVYRGHNCPTEVVLYDHDTLPNTPVWVGTNSIPVPRHFGEFSTTSLPAPHDPSHACQWYLVSDYHVLLEVNQIPYGVLVLAEPYYSSRTKRIAAAKNTLNSNGDSTQLR